MVLLAIISIAAMGAKIVTDHVHTVDAIAVNERDIGKLWEQVDALTEKSGELSGRLIALETRHDDHLDVHSK